MRDLLEKTISQIKKQGAEGDLVFQSSKNLKLSAFGNELSSFQVSGTQMLGLRLIKDQKIGIAFTESLDQDSLDLLVKRALENASASSTNEFEMISSESGEVLDNEQITDNVDVDTKVASVVGLFNEFKKKDSRVESLPYNGYAENENFNLFLSTGGRVIQRNDQFMQVWAMPLLKVGNKKSTFYDNLIAKEFKGLQWQDLINKTTDLAASFLESTHLKTGRYQVEFSTDSLGHFFQMFSGIFSGKSVVNKVNAWQKQVGQKVFHDDLTLLDDTHFKDAFSHYQCDGEGFKHLPTTLIENGVLKTFLHNSATAKELGVKNTFHAVRGPGSALGVGRTNFVLKSQKTHSFNNSFIEIVQMDGLFSGSNAVTGDFSCGVKGFLYQNGEKIPFADATLSGNFFDMMKNLSVLDSGLSADSGRSLFVPRMIFHDLSIAGL